MGHWVDEIKDREFGRCGFVIGNGYSGTFYDTKKIRKTMDAVLIGCNEGFKLHPLDYLVAIDPEGVSEAVNVVGPTCIISKNFTDRRFKAESVFFFRHGRLPNPLGPNELYKGHAGFIALSLAAHLGCNPIILFGCDCRVFKVDGKFIANRFYDKVVNDRPEEKDYQHRKGHRTSTGLMTFAERFELLTKHLSDTKGVSIYHLGDFAIHDIPAIEFEWLWSDAHPGRRECHVK